MKSQEAWTTALDWLGRAQERRRGGQSALAEDALLLALPLLAAAGEELTEGNAWIFLGQVRLERTDLSGAEAAFREAIRCFELGGHTGARARAALGLGEALLRLGRPGAASELLLEAIDRLKVAGSELHEALAWCALGEARALLGDGAAAREALRTGIQQAFLINAPGTEARARALLGRLALAEGAYGEALSQVGEAIDASDSVSDPLGIAWGLLLQAEIMRAGGRAWDAFWTARRAASLFRRGACPEGVKAADGVRGAWTFWGVVWLELTRRLGFGRGQLRSGA